MAKQLIFLLFLCAVNASCFTQKLTVRYVDAFENVNHPQVAYWFFTSSMLAEKNYKDKIDSFAAYSKYTLIFLTQRDGVDFYDAKTMRPVFERLVAYAHRKGLKIALQIWKDDRGTRLENTDRLMQEGELQLDDKGAARYSVTAKGAREMNTLLKSELFRVYAFKKTGDGFYDPSSFHEITSLAKSTNTRETVSVAINAGVQYKGYTAYILTQHYYNSCSNFSAQAASILLNAFKAYADIPFDGIGLDEYKNMKIARQKIMETTHDVFRERVYSLAMAERMKRTTGLALERVLLDMRYAPEGRPAVRIRAINEYMCLLRKATLNIEAAMYDLGKKMYGQNAFVGLHNTFHNNLDQDEVWQTGVSWWNIKRDYGHTDENTPTSIQMGIGMSYRENALYNMYYDKSLDKIWTKALYDLRFGVRTHYHAANDIDGWGVSIDAPYALKEINKVENAARLLNRFNPSLPKIKLLVIYGMEAMYNWYPNVSERGIYDINDHLGFEKKSIELWKQGYLNAAVPTDLINNGKLKLNAAGKPVLNGHVFDAIVFLNPQYATAKTTGFIKDFVARGGKLLLEGKATRDFEGKEVAAVWKNIEDKALADSWSMDNIEKLGVEKNRLTDGVANEDGSYTFTSPESLRTNTAARFSFTANGNVFSGSYKGIAVVKLDSKGNLLKLAATAFSSFEKNGITVLHVDREADIFFSRLNNLSSVTIADKTKSIKIVLNK